MSETDEIEEELPKKRSKLPLILGFVLALVGGGGGFFAVQSGLVFGNDKPAEVAPEAPAVPDMKTAKFLAVDPLVISLGPGGGNSHLRFRAQLEVAPGQEEYVAALMPRVVDVLNSYLRAVELRDLENPSALVRLRAQMLRRVQVVVGDGRVKDLLVMEFVLS